MGMDSLLESSPRATCCAEPKRAPSASAQAGASGSRRTEFLAAEYIKSHARRVAEIMSHDVVSVTELASLGEIADLMETKRIKRVPVLHDGKLVGIVSRADLLRVLASGAATSSIDDQDGVIRSRLLADLSKQKWANCGESDLVVSDGIVHLWGVVGSDEERRAL